MKSKSFIMELDRKTKRIGFYTSLWATAMVLFWIGVFKFTPTEARAIRPLVENHFLLNWSYRIFSLQAVSNAIGVIEIATSLTLIGGLFSSICRKIAAVAVILTFAFTLSFLFTTPNMWRVVDGILVTDFFILKDLVMLGFGLMLLSESNTKS
ncbi:MAG: DUF417 family protein [Capnocytophaga sp.]|nr:DUF417 family protein [Capnocytophaga sp.]